MAKAPEEKSSVRPVDLSQALGRLELRVGQAAELCGISTRQLIYWEERGYITCKRDGLNRLYDYAAIEKASLIKQALGKGLSLRRAVKAAESFLARQAEERAALEALSDEDLRRLVAARADRLGQLADHTRRRLRTHRVIGDVIHGDVPEEFGKLIVFLESNPYMVHTARQLGIQLGRPVEEVTKELDLLSRRRFLHKISYPRGDVYRYYPPPRPR